MTDKKSCIAKRTVAMLIDLVILALFCSLIFFAINYFEITVILAFALMAVLILAYFFFFEISSLAGTPGMCLMRIMVVYENDRKMVSSALKRVVCGFITCIPFMAGFWSAYFDKTGRTVYDYFSDSYISLAALPQQKSFLRPYVQSISPKGETLNYKVLENGTVFGRDTSRCNIVFDMNEPAISRTHCCLKYNKQTNMFLLEDLCSTYGTFLENGSKVKTGTFSVLKNGEKFYLGSKKHLFCVRMLQNDAG